MHIVQSVQSCSFTSINRTKKMLLFLPDFMIVSKILEIVHDVSCTVVSSFVCSELDDVLFVVVVAAEADVLMPY